MTIANPPVLLLGTGITVLGALRSLGKHGTPVYVIEGEDRLLRRSRWYRKPPFAVPVDRLQQLADWLPELPIDRAVLLPCSDAWARRVAEVQPILGDRFPACVPRPEVLDLLLDKGRFAETLQRLQVAHPWTAVIRSATD